MFEQQCYDCLSSQWVFQLMVQFKPCLYGSNGEGIHTYTKHHTSDETWAANTELGLLSQVEYTEKSQAKMQINADHVTHLSTCKQSSFKSKDRSSKRTFTPEIVLKGTSVNHLLILPLRMPQQMAMFASGTRSGTCIPYKISAFEAAHVKHLLVDRRATRVQPRNQCRRREIQIWAFSLDFSKGLVEDHY